MLYRKYFIAAGAVVASSLSALAADSVALIASDLPSANPYWGAVADGAMEKGKELGVETNVMAPAGGETDVAGQIAMIEDQVAKGVTGIAIAPMDTNAVVPVLEKAIKQGVKVVFIDKKADMPGVTYIGTDNIKAATIGAQYICDHIEKGSEVAILQGTITSTTGEHRAKGAHDGLEACGMNIVAEQPADWDAGKAQAVTENIITANPKLKAIFASNDAMALAAVEALKSAKLLETVMVVGFDGNPFAAESILKGELTASVAQRPKDVGGLGVAMVMKLIKGEQIDQVIDTGAELVTSENAEKFK